MQHLGLAAALSFELLANSLGAAQSWPEALDAMPLRPPVHCLDLTNCVPLMLASFQSNQFVKALIFMPGATDEFYLFRRARAILTNASPSLLDAVEALTNQTFIRSTFQPPFLLLHTDEDPLDPAITVRDTPTVIRLKSCRFLPHLVARDADWDWLQPSLRWTLRVDIRPWSHSLDQSWHFYRHSFAAWNLTGWEALEAAALAGKSQFVVEHKRVTFTPDSRVRATPHLDFFPR